MIGAMNVLKHCLYAQYAKGLRAGISLSLMQTSVYVSCCDSRKPGLQQSRNNPGKETVPDPSKDPGKYHSLQD